MTEAPAGLTDSVMRTVEADARPSARVRLAVGFATTTAIAAAVRLGLDGEPGLVARRCRVESAQPLALWVSVAASYETWAGADALRGRVTDLVRDAFGLEVARTEIDVVDVYTEADTA